MYISHCVLSVTNYVILLTICVLNMLFTQDLIIVELLCLIAGMYIFPLSNKLYTFVMYRCTYAIAIYTRLWGHFSSHPMGASFLGWHPDLPIPHRQAACNCPQIRHGVNCQGHAGPRLKSSANNRGAA